MLKTERDLDPCATKSLPKILLAQINALNGDAFSSMPRCVDAKLSVRYSHRTRTLLLHFFSLINLTDVRLEQLDALVDVHYENKWLRRLMASAPPVILPPHADINFKRCFKVRLSRDMHLASISLNVFLFGSRTIGQIEPDCVLGGANIEGEQILSLIKK